ncbi:MAG: T9SS type A sorting domain-containing protein [bacterium]|nr:T9SS type A sorting domain-containing protein [bacterium]
MKPVTTSFLKRLFASASLLLLLITLAGSNASAQSIRVTALEDTIRHSEPNVTLGVWYHVENLTNDTLHLLFRSVRTSVPTGWGVSMCVGSACYPEFIDSVTYDILPRDLDSCALDLYVGPEVGLTATASITIQRIGTTELHSRTVVVTSVDAPEALLPTTTFLSNVYPNPFNSQSVLQMSLPNRGNIGLAVYDISGRRIAGTQINGTPGINTIPLQHLLQEQTSGNYFIQVTTPYGNRTHRVTYLR